MCINIGIVGCGKVSKKHFDFIKNDNRFKLLGISDINSNAKSIADEMMVSYYSDYKELIKNENIEYLVICTPPSSHFEIIKHAVSCGVEVLCEKPLTLKTDEAKELIELSDKFNCKIFEIKQNRYNESIRAMRQAIINNNLGNIFLSTIRLRWCRYKEYFDEPWRGTYKHDGGVFASQSYHHIDLMRWLFGPVKSVYAKGINNVLRNETEDTGAAIIEYENGTMGIIEATIAARPENLEASISVLGDEGTIVIGGTHCNDIITWKTKDIHDYKITGSNDGHKQVYDRLYKYCKYNICDLPDVNDSYESIKIINALYESMDTNKSVNIDSDEYFNLLGK